MRLPRLSLRTAVLSIALTPIVAVLPHTSFLGAQTATPQPVAASVEHHSLAGVDDQARSETNRKVRAQSLPPGRTDRDPHALPVVTARTKVLSGVIRSKEPFSMFGVTWQEDTLLPEDAHIWARTQAVGESGWGEWTEMEPEDGNEDGMDGLRGGTAPFWTGEAIAVQVRLDSSEAEPEDFRVELIDPGTSDFDAAAAETPANSAHAMYGDPGILTRAAWGADDSRLNGTPSYSDQLKGGVLHHTAGENSYSSSQVPGIIRGIYAYHTGKGWNDIGYNFLVDKYGRVWEGRKGGITRNVRGAHVGGFNTDTFGVAMLGEFGAATPTSAGLTAVAKVFAYKFDLNSINPSGSMELTSSGGGTSRYPAGQVVTKNTVLVHRDLGYTSCAGDNLVAELSTVKTLIGKYMGATIVAQTDPPATIASGDTFKMNARTGYYWQRWKWVVTRKCPRQTVYYTGGDAGANSVIGDTWNGQYRGVVANPGQYEARMDSWLGGGQARPWIEQFEILPPANAPTLADPGAATAGGFYPLGARRLADSRRGTMPALGPGGRHDLKVTGVQGVPSTGVKSVALSVTAMCSSELTDIHLWPAGSTASRVAVVEGAYQRSQTGFAVVPVGTDGKVSISNAAGITDFQVDVLGYFADGGLENTLVEPQRVYDSASDSAGSLGTGSRRIITLPELGGVPTNSIRGAVLNLTVQDAGSWGSIAVSPYKVTNPKTYGVAYNSGSTRSTRIFVQANLGRVEFWVQGNPGRFTVDVSSVMSAPGANSGILNPISTVELATNQGLDSNGITLDAQAAGVPSGAKAALVRIAAESSGGTDVQVFAHAAGAATPAVPELLLPGGALRSNLALVPLDASGVLAMSADVASTVNVDLIGYLD